MHKSESSFLSYYVLFLLMEARIAVVIGDSDL